MSVVSAWILSIVGIIILSILVDLILPTSSTSSFIKNIFGYLIIIVVLSPVFSFLTNKTIDFDIIFKSTAVDIQEDFVSNVNRQLLNEIENNIENDCVESGILGVEVGISADIFSSQMTITQISINLKNMVIEQNSQHTNIKTSITEIIQKNIKVNKELIVFYE